MDLLEQAVATFERAQYTFTATLRHQELESKGNRGRHSQALWQTLPGVKDLGEDLLQQARTQIMTLARSKEVEDIESEASGDTKAFEGHMTSETQKIPCKFCQY